MINIHFETKAIIEGTSDGNLTEEQTIALLDALVGGLPPFEIVGWMRASRYRKTLLESAERVRADGAPSSPKSGD